MLLSRILEDLITFGHLTVVDASGRLHHFIGDMDLLNKKVTLRLHSRSIEWKILTNPMLSFGEGYMDEELSVVEGDIRDLLHLITFNMGRTTTFAPFRSIAWVRKILKYAQQFNPLGKAQKNVAHHYDLSDELYELFLDKDKQYSCAYFEHEDDTLEQAQKNKKAHIAAKLDLKPGLRVLDIGSGWGGLGLYLNEIAQVDVTGVTLSKEQLAVSRQRVTEGNLEQHIDFRLQDYRDVEGKFDRIVSVGMFEHLGVHHYTEFFEKIYNLLSDDGVAVIHSIGRSNPPTLTNAWTRKYIFPGGYIPSLSEVLEPLEKSGLWVTDIEVLRLHYAKTLEAWYRRFNANRSKVRDLYDERFCRMWDFYLAGSEMTFRHGDMMNFQLQLTKRVDTLPMTRDYMMQKPEAILDPLSENVHHLQERKQRKRQRM